MEEVLDFDEYIKNLSNIDRVYHLRFNLNSGRILELTPAIKRLITEKDLLEISVEEARDILNSSLGLLSYRVDITGKTKTLVPTTNIETGSSKFVIDDVLYRIPLLEFSDIKNPDVRVTYIRKEKKLKLIFKKNLKSKDKFMFSDGLVKFFITDYNDPNILLEKPIEVNIVTSKINTFEIKNMILPENYSIYTRRIFDRYILENK